MAVFVVGNLLFLGRWPFVHSDESWLAGLTRNMLAEGSLGVTEPFFDLKPRYPHAVKSLFHLLQIPFIALFGYSAQAVRMLSLTGGALCLILFWRAARRLTDGEGAALAVTALLACDVMFLYASHFARQEILLCAAMLGCVLLLLREDGALRTRTVLLLAGVTGLTVGLHPNSFLVACLCGGALLARACYRTATPRQLALYVAVTGGLAAVFVAASFAMDPQFPAHYLAYGAQEFDLLVPVTSKFGELGYFLQKLWHCVSGTYYLPELRLQLVAFPVLLALAVVYAAVMRRDDRAQSQRLATVVCAVAGVLSGMVLIGRYNQTSFVFFVSLCWLLLPHACQMFGNLPGRGVFVAVFAAAAVSTVACVYPWLSSSYDGYIAKIAAYLPPDARVIGNLNCDFYFANDRLLDYRNLAYLAENGMDFAEYVRANGVEYLLVSQELDDIYATRPQWNMIYGNPTDWYPQMQAFAAAHCTPLGSFDDPVYGSRIVEWIGNTPGTVRVYRVNRSHP